jgi:hypothetical protein
MTRTHARLVLAAVLLALFGPLLARDEVVFPHDNTLEVGLPASASVGPPSNRALGDVGHGFLPALHQQLQGNSTGWISTWDPHNALGRPSVQSSGLGKAYWLVHLVSWLDDDALRVSTWLALAAVVASSLFALLLLEELGLHPAAALVGALGVGVGSLANTPIAFTLFHWALAWGTAVLWAVAVFVRRPSAARGLVLAFCVHSLLVSAYPQHVVWQGYLALGASACLLARRVDGWRQRGALATRLAGWAALGAASAAPVHLALLGEAARSSRFGVDHEFLAEVLPSFASWADAARVLALAFDPFLSGNPLAEARAPEASALVLTPLVAVLACAAPWMGATRIGAKRRLWPLFAFVGACFALTLWLDAYRFAASHLGLGLSRTVPWSQAYVPLVLLAAFTADHALRGERPAGARGFALALVPTLFAALAARVGGIELASAEALFAAATALGVGFALATRRASVLVALAVAGALVHGSELRLNRARDEVCLDSPVLATLRRESAPGTRFAWVGAAELESVRERNTTLGPNQEGLFGLASIHAYDPLSSRVYQRWAAKLSVAQLEKSHGRRFTRAEDTVAFWRNGVGLSGVGLVLARRRLHPGQAELVTEVGGFFVHRPRVAPQLELATTRFAPLADGAVGLLPDPDGAGALAVERVLAEDERLVFRTTPSPVETLLVVSQQHHPGWEARAGGNRLACVRVEPLYQGVRLPAGTSEVELRFRSPVEWSWVPQLAFALAALVFGLRALARRFRRVVA